MKTISYLLSIIVLVILLISCEETLELDLQESTSNIVIEGLVTNIEGRQYVKISKTAGFYQSGPTKRVTNAEVEVTDDLGQETMFEHNPDNDPNHEGYYYAPGFKGEIGRSYTLSVMVNSEQYEATEKLFPVTKIDALDYRVNESQKKDPKYAGQYYELLSYMKEPRETVDYYLFKYFRNGQPAYFLENSDIYFTNDVGVGEDIDGFPSPVYFAATDTAKIEIYSLNRNAYLFYSDLYNLINSDGGMFTPPPTNPRSNISNGAFGLFQVSAVNSFSTVIKKLPEDE